jgi:DNA-binding response OmpR family regulator
MSRILLIDDDSELTAMLSAYLGREGFEVDVRPDGLSGLSVLTGPVDSRPDLVVLDVMLPGLDGFGVLRSVRDRGPIPPILMLTARGDDDDRIEGLELGADDYLSKPFNPRELVARLRAILRRRGETVDTGQVTVEGLVLDPTRIEARMNGVAIALTGAEFRVLELLARHVGRVVSRADLTDHALGRKLELYDRSIDTHVSNLRRKLGLGVGLGAGLGAGVEIRGVRGIGYQMTPPGAE